MRPSILMLLLLAGAAAPLPAQEIDTVRVGSASLRDAVPRLGTDSMESFRRVDGVDTPTSTTARTISRGRRGSEDVYVIGFHHASADGDTTVTSIVVRASDFSLLHHRVKGAADSAAVTVNDGNLTAWVVLPDQPVQLLDQRLARRVFPIEGQMPWLFPLLPLKDGYAAAIPHYSMWHGTEQWKTIRVTGSETVRHGAKDVDCWKVDGGELFPGYTVTYWVDKRTRQILQGVARGSEPGPEYWGRAK